MEGVTKAAAALLDARRDALNARFRAARGMTPRLDGRHVLDHLGDTVAPIVEAVAAVAADRAGEVLERLYDVSLDLLGRDIIGPASRHPAIGVGWRRLLGGLPRLTAHSPEAMARVVTNALHNVSSTKNARPFQWIDLMEAIGPSCSDVATFAGCGKVAAWLAGMAHYRRGALAACSGLDPALVAHVLGLADPGMVGTAVRELSEDPWLPPARAAEGQAATALAVVALVGGFMGFGGPFRAPPKVTCHDGSLVAFDHQVAVAIHADACGQVLTRMTLPPEQPGRSLGPELQANGRVVKGRLGTDFPHLAQASAWIGDGTTLAITLPHSHFVFLVAAARP